MRLGRNQSLRSMANLWKPRAFSFLSSARRKRRLVNRAHLLAVTPFIMIVSTLPFVTLCAQRYPSGPPTWRKSFLPKIGLHCCSRRSTISDRRGGLLGRHCYHSFIDWRATRSRRRSRLRPRVLMPYHVNDKDHGALALRTRSLDR